MLPTVAHPESEMNSLDGKLTDLSLNRVPRTTIYDLPGEILNLVTEHVAPGDLASLRLTNKAFYATSTKPFGINFLVHRRFVISRKGSQSLCDLAAHPVFARCVQSVLLATYRLSNFPFANLELDLSTSLHVDGELDSVLYNFMVWDDGDQVYLRCDIDICSKLGTEQELRYVRTQGWRRGGLRLDFRGKLDGKWWQRRLSSDFVNT